EKYGGTAIGSLQRDREAVDRSHVDTVLADTRGRQVDVGDDRLVAAERRQAEPAALAACTDFPGIESLEPESCKLLRGGAKDGRLPGPGGAGQEQRHATAFSPLCGSKRELCTRCGRITG